MSYSIALFGVRGKEYDMWGGRLSKLGRSPAQTGLLFAATAACLYLAGGWLHIPYGGGHIYSDIVTVFGNRFDPAHFSLENVPYVNTFVEYPPLTALFIYAMGALGAYVPLFSGAGIMYNYYVYSVLFLSVPTLLMIPELLKICEILGIRRGSRRTMLFYVATPSFLIMALVNWYIIGVYLATLGLRKYLQGSRTTSGLIFGLSAGSNLVTAAPALGLFLVTEGWRQRLAFAASTAGTFLAVNLPFVVLNRALWFQFWSYEESWYIEGSWMLAFLNNESPLRHYIFPALFLGLSAVILALYRRERKRATTRRDTAILAVRFSGLITFAYLFSTYVFTPQMNLILLPFFAVTSLSRRYWEFLCFEVVNALVIVYGFSQPLEAIGVSIPTPVQFGPIWVSPVQALAVARSLWVGKFLIYDGIVRPLILPRLERPLPSQKRAELEWLTPRVRGSEGETSRPEKPIRAGGSAFESRTDTRWLDSPT